MSGADPSVDETTLPVKRTEGDTLADRLTGNAYHNILPARYLRKNADGDLIEEQEDLFERVARNIALAEAVFEADTQGHEITVRPDQLKPDHPRRDELAAEVFGKGVTADADAETKLSAHNVNKFAYETLVPELPSEVREHVETMAAEFREQMERLSFMPNCVPPNSMVAAEGGLKRLTEIERGERVYDDRDGQARVESKFENGEKLVEEIETASGYTVRATPEHYFRVIADDGAYEWRQVKDLRPDDVLALQKNFLDDEGPSAELQPNRATDGGTVTATGGSHGRPRSTFESPDTMTPALAEWLGLYLGDGTARESGVRVAFDGQDDDLVDYWQELTDELFGFEPTTRERTDAECVIGQAFRRSLYEFLDRNDLLKETSKTATVPDAVLESSRTCIARFLRGLFEADGTVGDRAIEMYTHSEPLADQVQQLLLGLGVRSKIGPKRDGYRVTVRKNVCGKRFVERVGFRSERKRTEAERFETVSDNASSIKIPNQSERLHEWYQESEVGHDVYRAFSQFLIDSDSEYHQEIGVGIFRRYAEEYPVLWDSPVAEFVERDQFYEPVSEIRDVGRMAVEDMQVPRRNSYVVEGFVSHNSPTLMNAGDELQQLSACFVDSPEDDIDDIHQTAKEAAEVFQCLTEESTVTLDQKGIVSVSDVEVGDRILQQSSSGFQYREVEETHEYEDAETLTVELSNGLSVRGTPNHRIKIDGEWMRLDRIDPGQEVHYGLGWLRETDRERPALEAVPTGARWGESRGVDNEAIVDLYREGLSDYEIAERLDCGKSTVQRRRSEELQLPPNGSGGRNPGSSSFDETEAERLYRAGHTDSEIAESLGVESTSVQRFRARQDLEPNGTPVKTVSQPARLSDELAELVGLWLGDGSWHSDGVRFHVGRESVAEYIDQLSRKLFDTGTSTAFAEGCFEVTINSHEIKRWWETNFECKDDARSARVPEVVKRAHADAVEAFLRGYFTADGTLLNDTYPKLYSSSEEAVDDVATLMMGLGYPVKKSVIRDEEAHPYYGLIPTTGWGRESFLRDVGFVDDRRETALEGIESVSVRDSYGGDAEYTVEVESVTESANATVYDITVAGNHDYITDGIVSHNSGGGMGYAFWKLRPYGDAVGSTGGIASGPITFMRTYDQLCETIAQGGARRGAQMGVMRVSHPDVIQFIHAKNKDVSLAETLRLNDPDDFTHTSFQAALEEARGLIDEEGRVPEHLRNAVEGHLSNFNISVGITDDFMDAVKDDEEFTFTNPRTGEAHVTTPETRELYEMFGLGEYVEVGEELSIPAQELWDDIVEGAHENGEPGVIYLERVNNEHSFDVEEHPDHRILATNPCLTGDTLISTENGLVPAEELYEQGVARDVVVDGRLSEERLKEASSVYKTGTKDVYRLTTEEGYELRLTADHRVMTDEGWVEARNLDAGDTVHVQNRKGEFGRHGSAEEGRVLGWMVGDGHLKHGEQRAVLNFYDEDAEISEQFADDVNEIVREPTGNADYEIGVNEISRGDDYRGARAVEQRIRSTRLYECAEDAGLVDEKHQVPDAVMRGSEEMARGFLQALFTADGSVQGNKKRGRTIRLANANLDLLRETQQLLLNFGIASKIYEDRKPATTKELPDGTGGQKEYETKGFHDLIVSKKNIIRFRDEIGFIREDKNEQLDEIIGSYVRGPHSETFTATVESVDFDGNEEVYDLTEPDTHSLISDGIVTHNCGEQPLEEYEACNLGHINLSTLAAQDAPDWRVWYDEHGDAHPDLESAVEAFLQEAVDLEAFDRRIELGTRFLENVVTMSDFPVPEIERKVREMRKIGLGVMGLAQLYIQLGIEYGSEAGNELARQLMVHINHGSKWASHELAEERGVFGEWEDSKYADPVEYREWFEHQTGLDADEWEAGFPIRNHNSTTIAPTGCVEEESLVSTDQGIIPINELDETKAEFEQWDEIDIGVSTDGGTKTATAVYDNSLGSVKTIQTETGFSISATPSHRFRVLTKDLEYEWREAQKIEPGDSIVLSRGSYLDPESPSEFSLSELENTHFRSDQSLSLPDEMSPELALLLGFYVGDGHLHSTNGVELAVDSEYPDTVKRLIDAGERVFGVTATTEEKSNCTLVSIGGKHVTQFFKDNGWEKESRSAFVPEHVLRSDEESLKAFLRGLFEADGSAGRKVELVTSSETLSTQVQTLLLGLGIVFKREEKEPTVSGYNTGEENPYFVLRGLNRANDEEFLKSIGFISKSTDIEVTERSYQGDKYPPGVVELVRATDGYYESCSRSIKNKVNDAKRRNGLTYHLLTTVEERTNERVKLDGRELSSLFVDTVTSVSDDVAYTKDISVPSNNTYVANGFVTHNTTSMVGNTTGGCEPIYNVAYYKNVSDDVQGDEMLVEFDDYFLRVLEENGLDVEAVKEEAQAQMAANEFDGIDGLDTVPDAIGELFVTTGDLSAKEHAGVQVACQAGVDSAISKTVNAPNSSTVEDAKDVFEYIYDHGGKGVTYYRDGTRSKQVLTTRARNAEFAEMDETEAAEAIVENIREIFDDVEGFLDSDAVDAALDEDLEELLDLEVDLGRKQPRPDVLRGVTQRIDTGYGKLYVNINEDPETGRPFELFANIGNSGGFTASFTEALAKTISTALRSGVDPAEIADELQGIRSPKVAWDKGEQINSIPDAVGTAMRRYLDGEVDKAYPDQATLDETARAADDGPETGADDGDRQHRAHETDGGATAAAPTDAAGADPNAAVGADPNDDVSDDARSLLDAGESPQCPECSSMRLQYSEGCKTCDSCGWSEC